MLVKRQDNAFPIADIRPNFERLFRMFETPYDTLAEFKPTTGGWNPTLEVSQTDNHLIVNVELPGVDKNDMEITVEGDLLTVAGHKEDLREEKLENVFHSERKYGEFKRIVSLPYHVKDEGIDATFEKGVLKIKLARKDIVRTQRIPIKAI